MSNFYRCATCSALVWYNDKHTCPPAWECCIPDNDGDDFSTFFAHDAEAAAEGYSEQCDDNAADYSNEDRVVLVRKPGEEAAKTFRVTSEWTDITRRRNERISGLLGGLP